MSLQQTTSLRKIAALRKPIRVIRGGQGSAKTFSIITLIINHAAGVANREIIVLSAELTKMRLTVIKDFVKIMREAGLYEEDRFIAGTLYKFRNGSFIKFIGLDKEDVGKGLRCHVAYFNEVNKITAESYRQVASRSQIVYADYNPDASFYIDEDVIPREDCDFIQLTFNDNELLSHRERGEILRYKEMGYNEDGSVKSKYWANLWQVYGLGNIGNLQGVVFENWDIVDAIPPGATLVANGLDFGFTNDPTACGALFKSDGVLCADEYFYDTGLLNSDIIRLMAQAGIAQQRIVADSADPKSIEEIRRSGFRIEGAKKGTDSVRTSIELLHRYHIKVTRRSVNLIKELRSYRWQTDVNGKALNEPVDKDNHAIDAILRYPALNYLTRRIGMEIY